MIAIKVIASIVFVMLALVSAFLGMFAPMLSDAPENAGYATIGTLVCGIAALGFMAASFLVWLG